MKHELHRCNLNLNFTRFLIMAAGNKLVGAMIMIDFKRKQEESSAVGTTE